MTALASENIRMTSRALRVICLTIDRVNKRESFPLEVVPDESVTLISSDIRHYTFRCPHESLHVSQRRALSSFSLFQSHCRYAFNLCMSRPGDSLSSRSFAMQNFIETNAITVTDAMNYKRCLNKLLRNALPFHKSDYSTK